MKTFHQQPLVIYSNPINLEIYVWSTVQIKVFQIQLKNWKLYKVDNLENEIDIKYKLQNNITNFVALSNILVRVGSFCANLQNNRHILWHSILIFVTGLNWNEFETMIFIIIINLQRRLTFYHRWWTTMN